MIPIEYMILLSSGLLFLSIMASKISGRLGVPALLLFMLLGMLAGSDGIGKIEFDNAYLAQGLGVISLIFILFSGGLDTSWKTVRPIFKSGVILSTLGVVITCGLTTLFSASFLGLSFGEGLLLGAIISSTDAPAVFTILRSQQVGLRGQIRPLLEFESGSNDPMAVLLTIAAISFLTESNSSSYGHLVIHFFQSMILGGLGGFFAEKVIRLILNNIRLGSEGLYPVLTVTLILLTYSVTEVMGGNGFLAVYSVGVLLAKENFLHKKSLTHFHDGLAWLMQISMFLILGLLVFPSKLPDVAIPGLILSLFLIGVARPASVFVSLWNSGFSIREKLMVSWVGLRGAVPIILATYPLQAGLAKSELIFNLVFFIVFTSTLLQGPLIPAMARWLGVEVPLQKIFRYPLDYVTTGDIKGELAELQIPETSKAIGKGLIDLNMPTGVLVVLMQRSGDIFVPRGSTLIEAKDRLLVLAKKSILPKVKDLLDL